MIVDEFAQIRYQVKGGEASVERIQVGDLIAR